MWTKYRGRTSKDVECGLRCGLSIDVECGLRRGLSIDVECGLRCGLSIEEECGLSVEVDSPQKNDTTCKKTVLTCC